MREKLALHSAQSKAFSTVQIARLEVMAARVPPEDRELAYASLGVLKRMNGRMDAWMDSMNALLARQPDAEALLRSASTQDASLSALRKAVENHREFLEDGAPGCFKVLADTRRDIDRLERDYSHKGAKRATDGLRQTIKSLEEQSRQQFTAQAALLPAIERSCDYLDAHRADWSVPNGKLKFKNAAAKKAFQQAVSGAAGAGATFRT